MTELTRNGKEFVWTEQEKSFQELKQRLVTAPILKWNTKLPYSLIKNLIPIYAVNSQRKGRTKIRRKKQKRREREESTVAFFFPFSPRVV